MCTAVAIIATLFAPRLCGAGSTAAADYWAAIEAADARINSCSVTWSATVTMHPFDLSPINTDKGLARYRAALRGQGRSQERVEKGVAAERKILNMLRGGYSYQESLNMESNGTVIKGDVAMGDKVGPNVPPQNPATRAHYVDVYDGTNVITMGGTGPKTPTRGILERGPKPLQNCVQRPEELMFLIGAPISRYFSRAGTTISEGPDGTIVLQNDDSPSPIVHLTRLTVSKQTWRPVAYTRLYQSGKVFLSGEIDGYRSYPGGISFPSRISIKHLAGNGQVQQDFDAKLLSADFNNDAAVSDLKTVVPPGSIISDQRFGTGDRAAQYTVKNYIPTDDEIRELVAKEANERVPTRSSSPAALVLWIGSFLAAIGLYLSMRSRRRARSLSLPSGS